MAIIYVRSTDGSDVDPGTTWALAKATLAGAFAIAAAGDTIYVSQVHAETQASGITLTSPGTIASPVRVICGNDGATPPTALATTATISSTGASSAISFGAGFTYYYGITFSVADSTNPGNITVGSTNASRKNIFERCVLKINGSNGSSRISFHGASAGNLKQEVWLIDSTFQFGQAAQGLIFNAGDFKWTGSASTTAGTVPTTLLLQPSTTLPARVLIRGVDLSPLGSSNIINLAQTSNFEALIENCKLGSSFSLVTGTIGGATYVTCVNNDSGDTNYKFERQSYQGNISHEIIIVRSGGSSNGVTPFSRKMVSSANTKFFDPLESIPITFYNTSTGSITVEAEIVTDNVTLTDAEAWIEVSYPGTSGFPLYLVSSDRATNILTTPANQTTSTVTWTTTGLTTPVKQVLSVTFTPTKAGPIRARVMLAKASTTMYVDQLRLVGSGRQYAFAQETINEGPAGGLLVHGGMTGGMRG